MREILEARYLTVDFIVEADFDLTPVFDSIKDRVFVLYENINVESSTFGVECILDDTESPDDDISELLNVIDSLSDDSKDMLSRCRKKVFDIGFECGTLNNPIDVSLSEVSVRRISQLGGQINIRLYPWVESPEE